MNNESIVTFNVGGKTYQVKQSLLNRFPDTVLGTISLLWNNESHGHNEPIFLDRNGDRFPYILDYMRDQQKIVLPLSVSKESFVKDLEFYGFHDIIEDDIIDQSHHLISNVNCIDKKLNDIISIMQQIECVQKDHSKTLSKLTKAQEEFKSTMDTVHRKVRDIW